ncbi:hypothetical protein NC653_038818 [Populus alba x Populus x berolinensis]|uniref:Uncharacterized protein n=1 Tax=Populus alba x Populus x berolinensis TaxID=444605 RepID=A0AAD6LHY8_9ROSI|nr:hypothetical protein NC653_038818 [Populus alba x Populus x berolinensis]
MVFLLSFQDMYQSDWADDFMPMNLAAYAPLKRMELVGESYLRTRWAEDKPDVLVFDDYSLWSSP